MDLTARYEVCERDVAENASFGSTLLVPTTTNAGVFELNEMSARIWQELKKHETLDAACTSLIQSLEQEGQESEGGEIPEGHVAFTRDAFTEDFLAVATHLREMGAIKVIKEEAL